jgi:CTP synthase
VGRRLTPPIGICLGLQIAVVEFARNVLGLQGSASCERAPPAIRADPVCAHVDADAHSTEMVPGTPHPVVINMPEISVTHLGGTMRLGTRATVFVKPDCVTRACAPLRPLSLGLWPVRLM